jgi:hypothetical protein
MRRPRDGLRRCRHAWELLPVGLRLTGMSARLSRRVGRVLAPFVAVVVLTMSAACGSPSPSGPATPIEGSTGRTGNGPGPTVGYFVTGGLKPMGDQVTVTPEGTAVLRRFGKEVARCRLVEPQATSIREMAQQADVQAVRPSPKASKGPVVADMRETGLLYGDVRVESDRASAAAEPWPSLLKSMRAVYADLLQIGATGSPAATNPMCQ